MIISRDTGATSRVVVTVSITGLIRRQMKKVMRGATKRKVLLFRKEKKRALPVSCCGISSDRGECGWMGWWIDNFDG